MTERNAKKNLAVQQIDQGRRLLLNRLLDPSIEIRTNQKKFVRELVTEIKLLREAGVRFDEIANDLNGIGIELSANTLKSYFYEEMRQQKDNKEVAERMQYYREAADKATFHFRMHSGTDVESIVNKCLEAFVVKLETETGGSVSALPVGNMNNEGAKATPSEGGKPVLPELPKLPSTASRPGKKSIDELLNMTIDLNAIPERKD